MNNVEFIEEGHIYLKNGIITPSVSQLISYLFPDKYAGIPEHILNNAAEFGTTVHLAVEQFENNEELPELRTYEGIALEQYLKVRKKEKIEVLEQEQIISYKNYYCGRFDMIADVDGKLSLVDIKTTAILDLEYLSWQLSLYELGYGKRFEKLYAIHIPKKGMGRLVEIERKSKEEIIEMLERYANERP